MTIIRNLLSVYKIHRYVYLSSNFVYNLDLRGLIHLIKSNDEEVYSFDIV